MGKNTPRTENRARHGFEEGNVSGYLRDSEAAGES